MATTEQHLKPAIEQHSIARKIWLTLLITLFILAGLGYGVYWFTYGRYFEYTDNAYVSGNLVQLMPQVAGTVIAINADDTDLVQQGQPVVVLDKADMVNAFNQAKANLALTIRKVRQLYAQTTGLQAKVVAYKAELAKAQDDLKRRQNIVNAGAVSREILQHADTAVITTEANLQAAEKEYAANLALTENTTLLTHPEVIAAETKLRQTYLDLNRTTIIAPVTGYIAKRAVQLGQSVTPGTPLLAIVPINQVWVDANFKEAQLANIRIGQPVKLWADFYGDKVAFRGKVVGLAAGTGNVFSLLPPQNATGNWIKIVQRLPVRIALDQRQIDHYPLRVGLSMEANIDTHDLSGLALAVTPSAQPIYTTPVFSDRDAGAEAVIQEIIAANQGEENKM